MQRIVPCLWFDDQAEEATAFWAKHFADSKIGRVQRYGAKGTEVHGQPEGKVMTVEFSLMGYEFLALNGGPHFQITPAISFFVVLESREEVDALWAALSEGGTVMMPLDSYPWSEHYGWLSDRYGVTWQISLGKMEDVRQPISPMMLFVGDQYGNAEKALEHYVNTFPDSEVEGILRHEESEFDRAGTVQHAQFYLGGETFMVMDSGYDHRFSFNEAVSLQVRCDSQEEIDHYWEQLRHDSDAEQCGWLKDRFGVSWQIVPSVLPELLSDPERSERVTQAFLQMKKIDIEALRSA